MAYFDKHLGDGESVLLVGRPSWWLVGWPSLLVVAVAAVLLAVAGMLGGLGGAALAVTLPLILIPLAAIALVLAVPALVRVLTTEIVLTDRRVASKHGWFSIAVTSTPLDKVNNLNVQQDVLGRVFDYGFLEVTTATAEEKDNHSIRFLAHPNRFRDEVNEAIDAGV